MPFEEGDRSLKLNDYVELVHVYHVGVMKEHKKGKSGCRTHVGNLFNLASYTAILFLNRKHCFNPFSVFTMHNRFPLYVFPNEHLRIRG